MKALSGLLNTLDNLIQKREDAILRSRTIEYHESDQSQNTNSHQQDDHQVEEGKPSRQKDSNNEVIKFRCEESTDLEFELKTPTLYPAIDEVLELVEEDSKDEDWVEAQQLDAIGPSDTYVSYSDLIDYLDRNHYHSHETIFHNYGHKYLTHTTRL